MSAACALKRGDKMTYPEGNDTRDKKAAVRKRMRKKIDAILKNLNIQELGILAVIPLILKGLETAFLPRKVAEQDLNFEEELLEALGEERSEKWRRELLGELSEKLQVASKKILRQSSRKKKEEISNKFFLQEQNLMDACVLLGVDWAEIQELLDDTIYENY